MIALATNREGQLQIEKVSYKQRRNWLSELEQTHSLNPKTTSSHETMTAYIAKVSILGSSLFYSFQFRMVNPTITFQSHTNKQSIITQECENKSTRYQISIVIQTKPSLQAYNQCNHVGLPNPQLLGTVIGRTLESSSFWKPSPRVRK